MTPTRDEGQVLHYGHKLLSIILHVFFLNRPVFIEHK